MSIHAGILLYGHMRFIQVLSVATVLIAPTLGLDSAAAASSEASARCPAGAKGWDYDGLLLCVPAGKERYRLEPDGIGWMEWSGDTPIPYRGKDDPVEGPEDEKLDLSIARVWLGEKNVGIADSTSGQNGFDRFMELATVAALRAAQQASGAPFTAAIPVDESGRQQEFGFTYLEAGLLKGVRKDQSHPGPDFIVFRQPGTDAPPRVLMCSGREKGPNPAVMCLGIVTVHGHRAGFTIAGKSVDRTFRIFEEVMRNLESFVVRP
jgi:hypothetical protein